jgi:hypothetical protein
MQYRIQGARMFTGGKPLFVNLPDKLQEVCKKSNHEISPFFEQIYTDVSKRDAVGGLQLPTTPKTGDDEEENIDPNDHRPLLEFSTTSYAILEREQRVDLNPLSPSGTYMYHLENFQIFRFLRILEKYFQ